MCKISADSSQIFQENPYIIICKLFADNCSAVTDMLQIFADIYHICQFGEGSGLVPQIESETEVCSEI